MFFTSLNSCFPQKVIMFLNQKDVPHGVVITFKITQKSNNYFSIIAPVEYTLNKSKNCLRFKLENLSSNITFGIWNDQLKKRQSFTLAKQAITEPGTYELTYNIIDGEYLILNLSPISVGSDSVTLISAAYNLNTQKLIGNTYHKILADKKDQ